MSRVSVVIPLYNDHLRIERAMCSALDQMHLKEVIVVDDCSSDASVAVVQRFSARHSEIKIYSLTENSGPAAARNFGASMASGEFLCFLDSDDELLDGYFSEVVPLLDANPKFHAFKVGMEFFDSVRGYVLPAHDPRYSAAVFSSACNVLIRRDSFNRMGGFPVDMAFRAANGGEDHAFCEALAKHLPPLGKIEKPYYRCWSYEGSHLHRFLSNTRLAENAEGFQFVSLTLDQRPDGDLSRALHNYSNKVRKNLEA